MQIPEKDEMSRCNAQRTQTPYSQSVGGPEQFDLIVQDDWLCQVQGHLLRALSPLEPGLRSRVGSSSQ